MTASLGLTVLLYAVAVAGLCLVTATAGRGRSPALSAALVMLQVGAVGYAALDGIALLRSDHGPGTITNAGYLLTAVAVLPVTATVVELDRGRWGNAAFGIGCLLLAVVSFRMHQTLGNLDG